VSVDRPRCAWVGTDPIDIAYHDDEWGVPVHDDHRLLELITLEGAQAGLSWSIILRKRDGYRRCFADFDPGVVAAFDDHDVEQLLLDASIVRHRGKITSTIDNARAVLAVQQEFSSFDAYVWSFVGGTPIVSSGRELHELPSQTAESKDLSKDLKRRGFRFVGPTTVYAFMQAAGLADDHTVDCFRRQARTAR
jgi:DNA-3-methyladenine glycosylase I